MNKQKLIFYVLGLVVAVGLGFWAVGINNKVVPEEQVTPTGTDWPPQPDYGPLEFGQSFTLARNSPISAVSFTDGLGIYLQEINDSRCPDKPGVECIWQGELSVVINVAGGKFPKPQDIRLGTVKNGSVTMSGYTFTLKDATTTSATIVVVKN